MKAGLCLLLVCLAAVVQAAPANKPLQLLEERPVAAMTGGNLSGLAWCQGALWALLASHSEMADLALPRFHDLFRGDALVIDKWFALQASAPERDGRVFARAKALLKHPDFTLHTPTRARSLVRSLCGDHPAAFHRAIRSRKAPAVGPQSLELARPRASAMIFSLARFASSRRAACSAN